MIPNQFTLQIGQLKEKFRTYSSISRSYKIDEIRSDLATINNEIAGLNRAINNILMDGLASKIEIENWFEGLLDRSEFIEPNPRLVYEEEQREIERQKKLAEEKKQRELKELQKRQKQEQIDAFRKLLVYGPEDAQKVKDFIADGFNFNDDFPEIGLNWLLCHGRSLQFIELLIDAGMKITANDRIELERQKKIIKEREIQKIREEENAVWEAEERQTRLRTQQRIEEFRRMCLDKQSKDLDQLRKLIIDGLDVNCINDFDGLTKIVFWNKSLSFIQVLVDSGLHITKKNVRELYSKYEHQYNEANLFDLLISSKNIDSEALAIVKETIANRKIEEQKNEESKKLNEQKLRIKEFKNMCQFSFSADINKIKKLIDEGLNINEIEDFDCLESCISWTNPNLKFIDFLVDAGILVKNKHIEYCYSNKLYGIISILEKAKNIEIEAAKNILKRTKFNVIGTISATCIFIFFLFIPWIFNKEMDTVYYILVGITCILSLLIAINFSIELRRKSQITIIAPLSGNQLSSSNQSGYEIIEGLDKKVFTESRFGLNHKEKKAILQFVVTLILASIIIVLIIVYFEEIIAFIKLMLILGVIVGLFIWRYSPTKRR